MIIKSDGSHTIQALGQQEEMYRLRVSLDSRARGTNVAKRPPSLQACTSVILGGPRLFPTMDRSMHTGSTPLKSQSTDILPQLLSSCIARIVAIGLCWPFVAPPRDPHKRASSVLSCVRMAIVWSLKLNHLCHGRQALLSDASCTSRDAWVLRRLTSF